VNSIVAVLMLLLLLLLLLLCRQGVFLVALCGAGQKARRQKAEYHFLLHDARHFSSSHKHTPICKTLNTHNAAMPGPFVSALVQVSCSVAIK
jgi:hypothetical protein